MKFLFRKARFILRIIFQFKISINLPKKTKLILFDCNSREDFRFLLKNYNYFILQERLEKIEKIYLNFEIIKYFLKYFRGSVKLAYLCSIIHILKPKIIITNVDNSLIFSDLAKIFYKKINFFAIQNGRRFDIFDNRKKFFIPNFFCFGNYDKDLYLKLKVQVVNYYPVGSLRLSNYLMNYNSTSRAKKKLFDICFIIDELDEDYNPIKKTNIKFHAIKFLKYIIKFCITNNFKLIILYKGINNDKKINQLKILVNNFLTNKRDYNFFLNSLESKFYILKNFKNAKFRSYKIIDSSEILCGCTSTLLIEKIILNGKILVCNFTHSNLLNFPDKGISFLRNPSYKTFEERLKNIYKMKASNYFNRFLKDKDYYVSKLKNEHSILKIRSEIDKFL